MDEEVQTITRFHASAKHQLLRALAMATPELSNSEFRLLQFYTACMADSVTQNLSVIVSVPIRAIVSQIGMSVATITRTSRRLAELGWIVRLRGSSVDLSPALLRVQELSLRAELLKQDALSTASESARLNSRDANDDECVVLDSDLVPV